MGITEEDSNKWRLVYEQAPDIKYVCIDVANGYSERFLDYVKQFRELYPNIVIIAGNVVTADQTQELILNGADIVKVGIGPGSVCTTRIQTGVGYPSLVLLLSVLMPHTALAAISSLMADVHALAMWLKHSLAVLTL